MIRLSSTTDEDLPALWDIIKDVPEYWAESDAIQTEEEFSLWFKSTALSPLTGFDVDEVIGCGYLDAVYPGYYGSVNIFKRRGQTDPRKMRDALRGSLSYWMCEYDLEKLIAVIRVDNTASRMLAASIGFKLDGILRHHKKVHGEWTDYALLSILRGELCLDLEQEPV